MPRPKHINRNQLCGLYWPEWRKAEKVLIAAGFSKDEAEEKRMDIHVAVTGEQCSSKDLKNRQLDEVLRMFAQIAQPNNGARQADLADGECKRLRFAITEAARRVGYDDASVETMALRMTRRSLIQCDEAQLKTILQALKIHETRHPEKPDPA